MESVESTYQGGKGWAADATPESRPGVPRELSTRREGFPLPARQPQRFAFYSHAGREELTPVFGTAPAPRGLSGAIRAAAYRIPEHKPRHWLALLLADRVDVVESAIRRVGMLPLAAAAGLAGAVLARRSIRLR